jgi:hypothetical protein
MSEDTVIGQLKRIGDFLERMEKRDLARQASRDAGRGPRPCKFCQQPINWVSTPEGKRKPVNPKDGSDHHCPGPPKQPGPSTPPSIGRGTDNAVEIMDFLTQIWPKEPSAGVPTVTDCGDHWEIPNPRMPDRDKWRQFANALRQQFGREYVSDPELHKYYFRIEKVPAK